MCAVLPFGVAPKVSPYFKCQVSLCKQAEYTDWNLYYYTTDNSGLTCGAYYATIQDAVNYAVYMQQNSDRPSVHVMIDGNQTQKAQESWAKKERSLQAEAAQLQQKYEKGLITTRDAQAKQESIQKRANSFQTTAQREAATLDEENRVFTNRLQDLVMRAVQEINADKQYKMIVNANSLLDADTTLNITPMVLEKVNELYAAEKESAKKK